jgi:signal transduction histidine kinase
VARAVQSAADHGNDDLRHACAEVVRLNHNDRPEFDRLQV